LTMMIGIFLAGVTMDKKSVKCRLFSVEFIGVIERIEMSPRNPTLAMRAAINPGITYSYGDYNRLTVIGKDHDGVYLEKQVTIPDGYILRDIRPMEFGLSLLCVKEK